MTNVIPTPITAHTAMFCEISEKLLAERNLTASGDREEEDDHQQHAENPYRL